MIANNDSFIPFALSKEGVDRPFITSMAEDNQGFLLVGTRNGLFQENSTGNFQPVSFPSISNNRVVKLLNDPTGTLWIGFEEEGLIRIDSDQNQIFPIRYDPSLPRSLSNDLVYDILYDTFGNLWVGTLNGINRSNINNSKFDLFQNKPGMRGHTSNSIFGIEKDQSDGVWTATRDGVFHLDRTNNLLQEFNDNPASKPTLSGRAYRAIYYDLQGQVWLGIHARKTGAVGSNTKNRYLF